MLNAKKIGVIVVTVAVAGTLMFFGIKANRSNLEQNVENTTSISQEVENPVEMETDESAVKDDLDKGSGLTEEEKNIDEAVTTIDEVEADEQGQLAANAGGSGEAEVYETGEEDVVVGKDPSLVENTENSDQSVSSGSNNVNSEIDLAGGNWGFVGEEKDPSEYLPSEEEMQEAWDLVEQNNTNLH